MDSFEVKLFAKVYGTLFMLLVYWPINSVLYLSGWQGVMKVARNNRWANWFLVCYFGFFFLVYFQVVKLCVMLKNKFIESKGA